jgi:hypothetical protein
MRQKWTILDKMVLVGVCAFALFGAFWLPTSMGLPRTPGHSNLVLSFLLGATFVLDGGVAGHWLRYRRQ